MKREIPVLLQTPYTSIAPQMERSTRGKHTLTHIDKVTWELIVPGIQWYARHGANVKPLSDGTTERAILAVRIYKDWLRMSRQPAEDIFIRDYTSLVGKVYVDPVYDVPGEWMMNFKVTHKYGEEDRKIITVYARFNSSANKLNDPTKRMCDSRVYGRGRDGSLGFIGLYDDIYLQSNGDVAKFLGIKGYYQIGEIGGFYEGLRSEFLPSSEPSGVSLPTGKEA